MHTIYIRDLIVSATHGYYSFEHEKEQRFKVSVTVTVSDWSHGDVIEETINYELLRNVAIKVLATSPKRLLETLADEITEHVLKLATVTSSTVTLEKIEIFPDCVAGVSVTKNK